MTNDAVRNRLMKLLALARQGVGGERENAQSALNKLLTKHGLSLEDLDDEGVRPKRYFFRYRDDHERALLVQCVAVAVPNWDRVSLRRNRRKEFGVDLTPGQYLEVDILFNAHRAAFDRHMKKHIRLASSAYMNANHLVRETSNPPASPTDLSGADMEAVLAMMRGAERVTVRKRLASGC